MDDASARSTSSGTSIDFSVGCGGPVPKSLSGRVHSCLREGLVICRDWNAARSIKRRADFRPGHAHRVQAEPMVP